jgi:histidyl-tRNA synthetase
MKPSLTPYKGARDFYPEDKQRQKWLFDVWRKVVERYGYQEYDAPILEPTSLYTMKGSQEIVNEQTYTFTDRGDRSVTIRTEMTPSVSRMIAGRRQELAYPARWYSIPNVWRYERTQRGRLREFWQLNVDMFGVDSIAAELEMLQIADDLMRAFHAKRKDYVIKLNSRQLVNAALTSYCGLSIDKGSKLVRLIDRIHKMSTTEFVAEVQLITEDVSVSKRVIDLIKAKTVDMLPAELHGHPSLVSLQKLLKDARSYGITNIEFDITLMRGFDYYTDIVFEVFDTDPENNRSMFGGGRYDGLVAQFGVEPVPTVGFGMGDVTFMNFLESHKLVKKLPPPCEVVMIVREKDTIASAQRIAQDLREMGMKLAVDISGSKFDKQFKNAVKSGANYVIVVGEEEIKNEVFTLKDLRSGSEQKHSMQRIVSIVKDHRRA